MTCGIRTSLPRLAPARSLVEGRSVRTREAAGSTPAAGPIPFLASKPSYSDRLLAKNEKDAVLKL